MKVRRAPQHYHVSLKSKLEQVFNEHSKNNDKRWADWQAGEPASASATRRRAQLTDINQRTRVELRNPLYDSVNPRPDGPLDFPPPDGGGGCLNTPVYLGSCAL